jgi:hypothetical protein
MNTENNNNIVWTVTVRSGYITLYFDFEDMLEAVKFAYSAAKSHRSCEYDYGIRVNATFVDEPVKKEEII